MRPDTIRRKNATKAFRQISGEDEIVNRMYQVLSEGKRAFDAFMMDMGKMLAESILYIEREEKSGPDYFPKHQGMPKWGSQGGSVFIGDQKVKLQVPRLRRQGHGEVHLGSYQQMKEPGQFSEELLQKALRGISTRNYHETVLESAKAFGVSPSSVSSHIVEVTVQKLKEFQERPLQEFRPFAIFIDTIHRGDEAFIVALAIDLGGNKLALGFWQGATENSTICNALLTDLERRGLKLSKRIIWVTDGGSGVIKSLRDRFGKKLIHQRCTIHKDRNIQKHLAKKYRKEASSRFRTALEQTSYSDAKQMLLDLEKWLRERNESAAHSLLEALEEILTLHRLKVPGVLRKTLHSTNPIESMFSIVRDGEANIKNYQGSRMMQRWLASVLLYAETRFRKIKGFKSIWKVRRTIKQLQSHNMMESTEQKVAA
jgi:transposase-like protein